MKLVALALLGGCVFEGDNCPPPGCVSDVDGAPTTPVDIAGHVQVTQTVGSVGPSCPPITARDTFTWTVVDASPKTLTADPPIVVQASLIRPDATTTDVRVLETDDWGGGMTPSLDYDLGFRSSAETDGGANGTLGACAFYLSVHAKVVP